LPASILPPPKDHGRAEDQAIRYIYEAKRRIEEQYGIRIKTGLELECYAIDPSGTPTSDILSVEQVQNDLLLEGCNVQFEDENTLDYKGQYEAITGVNDPLETIQVGENVRQYLSQNPAKYGLEAFDFSPRPFPGQEASSVHISLSLWDIKGKPLFSGKDGRFSPLLYAVAHGMIETQKNTVLLSAQTDGAYERFGNSAWSPSGIGVDYYGDSGRSLRIANENGNAWLAKHFQPEDVRIENRLPAADSNLAIAMAASILGVEYALQHYVRVFKSSNDFAVNCMTAFSDEDPEILHNITRVKGQIISKDRVLGVAEFRGYTPRYPLPQNRAEALYSLKEALTNDPISSIAGSFLNAVVKQHDESTPAPEPEHFCEGISEAYPAFFPCTAPV